jgi:copper chaperone CopZ
MNRTVSVTGMTCGHCAMRVREALEGVPGIEKADVDHEKGIALITASEDVPLLALKSAVDETGYKLAAEIAS